MKKYFFYAVCFLAIPTIYAADDKGDSGKQLGQNNIKFRDVNADAGAGDNKKNKNKNKGGGGSTSNNKEKETGSKEAKDEKKQEKGQ